MNSLFADLERICKDTLKLCPLHAEKQKKKEEKPSKTLKGKEGQVSLSSSFTSCFLDPHLSLSLCLFLSPSFSSHSYERTYPSSKLSPFSLSVWRPIALSLKRSFSSPLSSATTRRRTHRATTHKERRRRTLPSISPVCVCCVCVCVLCVRA